MSGRLKICLVLPSHWASNFGGAEYQVRLLLEELLAYWNTDIVYLARFVSGEFSDSRYTVRKISPIPYLSRLGFWVDAVSLLRHLYREKPDVIYQRVGCAYTGICAFFARRNGCRMIWHISIDSELSMGIGRFPRGSRQIERRLRDYGIRRSDLIIAQTDAQVRTLKAEHGRNAQVIRNFQPVPDKATNKASRPTVIWVANLKPAKRPEAYVDVAKMVSRRFGVEFVMVGRGGDNDSYAVMLDEASKVSDLSYIGEKSINRVNELISSAHILINTSTDEGFPNTFIQAWYRHAVVVTLGIDPDGILVKHSCGFVCATVDEIVIAVERLVQDEELRTQMAERAFNYAIDAHSLRNAKSLAKMLAEIW